MSRDRTTVSAGYCTAWVAPGAICLAFVMSLRNLILFGLAASALLSLSSVGLNASLQDATYLFRRPVELARALLAMNLLMPLFAIALISISDFTPAVRIALVALSLSPIPPPVPAKEVKSGGAASYVISLHVAIGLLAIVLSQSRWRSSGRSAVSRWKRASGELPPWSSYRF